MLSKRAAAAVLVVLAALLLTGAWLYPWDSGYDALAYESYSRAISEGRLPSPEETYTYHTPPLFMALALLTGHTGAQLLNALATVGTAALAYAVTRRVVPASTTAPLIALLVAGASPVAVRAAVMFHPEPLATFFASCAVYLTVRGREEQRRLLWWVGVGAVLGLSTLTRTWGVAVGGGLVLALLLDRKVRAAAAVGLAQAAVAGPWFLHQAVAYGDPLAFSREPTHPSPGEVVRALPMVYADWWGDWFHYFTFAQPRVLDTPGAGPAIYLAGVVPTLLIVLGLVWLVRRGGSAWALVLPAGAVVAAFLYFQSQHLSQDLDTAKASYLLSALLPVAVFAGAGAAVVEARLRPEPARGRAHADAAP